MHGSPIGAAQSVGSSGGGVSGGVTHESRGAGSVCAHAPVIHTIGEFDMANVALCCGHQEQARRAKNAVRRDDARQQQR